jgi:hypothetical protein
MVGAGAFFSGVKLITQLNQLPSVRMCTAILPLSHLLWLVLLKFGCV